jgi:AcrR family transcriptional regulator
MNAPGTTRPGGRTARIAQAVFAATIDELSACGYESFCIENVAARAGVHKTTVYRRWRTKEELIIQALTDTASIMIGVPDNGSVEADLRALSRSIQATLASPEGGAITRTLLAGAVISPEIRQLMQQFWAARGAAIAVIVDRAVRRGELPARTEPAPMMQAMAAPLYYRLLVTGEPLTEQDADLSAATALAAARAGVFAAAQDEVPAAAQAEVQAATQAEVPAAAQDGAPAAAQDGAPAAAQDGAPAAAQPASPAAVQAESPAGTQAESPAGAQAESPAGTQAERTAGAQAGAPAGQAPALVP